MREGSRVGARARDACFTKTFDSKTGDDCAFTASLEDVHDVGTGVYCPPPKHFRRFCLENNSRPSDAVRNGNSSSLSFWSLTLLAVFVGAFAGTRLSTAMNEVSVSQPYRGDKEVEPAAGNTPWNHNGSMVAHRAGDGEFYLDAEIRGKLVTFRVAPSERFTRLNLADIMAVGQHLPSTGDVMVLEEIAIGEVRLDYPAVFVDRAFTGHSVLGADILNTLGFVSKTGSHLIIDLFAEGSVNAAVSD